MRGGTADMKNEEESRKLQEIYSFDDKEADLPKLSNNQASKKMALKRKPLVKRRVDTGNEDVLEAELPIMKTHTKRSTFVSKEEKVVESSREVKVPPKKNIKSKKKVLNFLFLGVFVLMAVYCTTRLNFWNYENEDSSKQLDDIQGLVVQRTVESEEKKDEEKTGKDKKDELLEVDFTELLKVNPDTVAYIKIEGLGIDAPIVQTVDNDFYLSHSFDKSFNSAGWIFGDYRDDWVNLKDNTIVYGHNRRNYMMFGALKKVLDSDWNKEKNNHYIYVSTKETNFVFQMFSAYTIPTTSDYLQNEFDSKDEFSEFLKLIGDRSQVDFGTTVTNEDKILTLSTCYTNTSKTVIHAKLVNSQKK